MDYPFVSPNAYLETDLTADEQIQLDSWLLATPQSVLELRRPVENECDRRGERVVGDIQ